SAASAGTTWVGATVVNPMPNHESQSPTDPRDQLIAELRTELQQLQARVAHLEQSLTSPEPITASSNMTKRRWWLIVGSLLLLGVLVFASAATLFPTTHP